MVTNELLHCSRALCDGVFKAVVARLTSSDRADDKSASEYNLEGGATLHLVLALRGGY